MMKFIIQKESSGSGRCGLLAEFGRHGDKTLETPACMMYTRGGKLAAHLEIYTTAIYQV